jgi:hypothetical protein
MLKKLGSPDTVLAVEVVGKLEKDDYVLVPGLQARSSTRTERSVASSCSVTSTPG